MAEILEQERSVPASDAPVYLSPKVKFEPLLLGWHAWLQLLSPPSHAMHLEYRQIPLMKSFIASPAMHVSACADAAAADGRFVDLPETAAAQVSELLRHTLSTAPQARELAAAYVALNNELQANATGYSLAEHYARIAPCLKGMVELVYDLDCHPRIRLFEALASVPDAQLEQISIATFDEDERKFFLTTPRLDDETSTIAPIGFRDPCLDMLATARTGGVGYATLCAQLARLGPRWEQRLAGFLTAEPPRSAATPLREAGLRVRYFGHACVLVGCGRTNILLDPLVAWEPAADGRYTFAELPQSIDAVAFTHGHHDHFCSETLLQIRHKTRGALVPACNAGNIADPSMRLALSRLGYANIRALEPLETAAVGEAKLTSLPFLGEHADLDIYGKQGVLVEIGGRKLVFLADSNAFDAQLYARLKERLGAPDALFIGMECFGASLTWLYGPLLTRPVKRRDDESRRLSASDADAAIRVVDALAPKHVFLYAMGQERWVGHYTGFRYDKDSLQLREAEKFLQLCRGRNVPATHLVGSRDIEIA